MKILPLGDKNDPSGVAIFYEIEDDTLETIRRCPDYYLDRTLVQRCFAEKGKNAHLYLLINGGELRDVVKNLRKLMNEYKTVSWWTVEHKKFYIRSKPC